MSSGCDICVDPSCGGKKNCNCETCSRKDSCYRHAGLKPTIRITRRCTQACAHCCFECGPGIVDGDMTITVAENIRRFCQVHQIKRAEAMGGEFFTHPEWPQIFHILADKMRQVRLVTNGDWAGNARTASAVIGFLKLHPQFHVGVSKDRWHTNAHVDAATRMLQEAGIPFRLPTPDQIEEQSLVPVGRNRCEWTQFYGTFGCYCGPAERRYSFLVDELGRIYKCGFGSWPYASVADYLDGGFFERFKEFNTEFYQAFVPNCAACQRAEAHARRKRKEEAPPIAASRITLVSGDQGAAPSYGKAVRVRYEETKTIA